jgi:hypothetical protein
MTPVDHPSGRLVMSVKMTTAKRNNRGQVVSTWMWRMWVRKTTTLFSLSSPHVLIALSYMQSRPFIFHIQPLFVPLAFI